MDPADWFFVDLEPITLNDSGLVSLGTIHDESGTHAGSFIQAATVLTRTGPGY
jgi:hypothetical protein